MKPIRHGHGLQHAMVELDESSVFRQTEILLDRPITLPWELF